MARAKNPEDVVSVAMEEYGVTVAPPSDDEVEDENIIDRMRAIMASADDARVHVKLYRANPQNPRKGIWCADYTPDEFEAGDLGMVRTQWGPGDYEIRLIGRGGVAGRIKVTIAAPYIPPGGQSIVSTQPSELTQLMRTMADGQARMLDAITQRPKSGENMAELLSMMSAVKSIMGDSAPQPKAVDAMAQLTQMMAMLRGLKETARELSDDEIKPDASDPMTMLPKILELVGSAVQRPAENVFVPPVSVPASMSTAQMPVATLPPITETQQESIEQMIMRGAIETLIEHAEKGDSIEIGGEYIADNFPDEFLPYLKNKYWFEVVARIYPLITKHEKWIREAKAHADMLLQQNDVDAVG